MGGTCGTHVYRILLENLKETVCLEDLIIDVWIILKWTLEKQGGLYSSGSVQGQVSGESWYTMQQRIILLNLTSGSRFTTGKKADPSTHSSEPPCPVECGEVLDYLWNYYILKNDHAL